MRTENRPTEALLKSMARLRLLLLGFQIALVAAGTWAAVKLADSLKETYFVSSFEPIARLLVIPLALFLAIRAYLIYTGESNLSQLARHLDLKYHLKDRCSTYVELSKTAHPFFPSLAKQLDDFAGEIRAFSATNFHPGMIAPAIFALVFGIAMLLQPYLPIPYAVAKKKEEMRQIARVAAQMKKELKEIAKKPQADPKLKELMKAFEKSATELQKQESDRVDALKTFNALQQKLENTRAEIAKSNHEKLSKELSKLGGTKPDKNLAPVLSPEEAARLAEQLRESVQGQGPAAEELANALRNGRVSRENAEKLKKSLQDFKAQEAESAQKLADLKQQLENSRKGIAPGKGEVTYDSQIADRDVQKSKGGIEDGPGTTNKDIGPQHFDTKRQKEGGYAEDRTRAKYENLYKGQREKVGSEPLYLQSEWGDKTKYTNVRDFGLDSDVQREKTSAVAGNQDETEATISKENVPASYREMVKDYLDSIQH